MKNDFYGCPLYWRWHSMKQRCYNPNRGNYKYYGGRGISVYEEWKNNYTSFHYYMMKLPNAMQDGYTIDRIDNNGDYEPGNVRWADRHTQIINARINKNNKSGYVGVAKKRRFKKWYSYININRKQIHLGCHTTIKKAVNSRNNYIIENNLDFPIQ